MTTIEIGDFKHTQHNVLKKRKRIHKYYQSVLITSPNKLKIKPAHYIAEARAKGISGDGIVPQMKASSVSVAPKVLGGHLMLVLYIRTTGWITGQPRNATCDEMIYGSYIATFIANHGKQERRRLRLC